MITTEDNFILFCRKENYNNALAMEVNAARYCTGIKV